jgi:hypothetical protein
MLFLMSLYLHCHSLNCKSCIFSPPLCLEEKSHLLSYFYIILDRWNAAEETSDIWAGERSNFECVTPGQMTGVMTFITPTSCL